MDCLACTSTKNAAKREIHSDSQLAVISKSSNTSCARWLLLAGPHWLNILICSYLTCMPMDRYKDPYLVPHGAF